LAFSSRTSPPSRSPLFPYTTLFRSGAALLWLSLGAGPLPAWAEDAEAESVPAAAEADTAETTDTGAAAGADTEAAAPGADSGSRSEEHTSELQSRENLVCRLLLEKK